ncbi:MAG: hypothetical protein JWR37_4310 [Mycobacterium sp.]|nr:hypothetical protein [Mycobacterium sp.]
MGGDDIMAKMALPASETAEPGPDGQSGVPAPPLPAPPVPGAQPNTLVVSGQQRAYLDALVAGGVRPSSELLALSIGSYVCQARAANQSDEAVWDFIVPLVRSDVRNSDMKSMAPTSSQVDTATASYIRIATQQLC